MPYEKVMVDGKQFWLFRESMTNYRLYDPAEDKDVGSGTFTVMGFQLPATDIAEAIYQQAKGKQNGL